MEFVGAASHGCRSHLSLVDLIGLSFAQQCRRAVSSRASASAPRTLRAPHRRSNPCATSSTTSPPALSTRGTISSVLSFNRETFRRKSSGIFIVTLATGLHLLRQHLDIHPASLHIFHRGNLKTTIAVDYHHSGHDSDTGNTAKTEKVGGFGELSAVRPFLIAVPTFPIGSDRCQNDFNRISLPDESCCGILTLYSLHLMIRR